MSLLELLVLPPTEDPEDGDQYGARTCKLVRSIKPQRYYEKSLETLTCSAPGPIYGAAAAQAASLYDFRPERIEPLLVSVMMPFHPGFDEVYRALRETVESAGLKCRRADDIWENPAVMQDVVSLIDRSRVVIRDCTSRNANVFYEIGIAHTLGREVILITRRKRTFHSIFVINRGELHSISNNPLHRAN